MIAPHIQAGIARGARWICHDYIVNVQKAIPPRSITKASEVICTSVTTRSATASPGQEAQERRHRQC